jgi:uncharacterized protein YidB (DUF937 family)
VNTIDDRSFDQVSEDDRRLALALLEDFEKLGSEGIKARLEKAGDPIATRSWVSLERAMPVTPDTVEKIFEPAELEHLRAKLGTETTTKEWLVDHLARLLPRMIGRLSPLGKLPTERALRFQTSELRRKLAR